VTCNPDCPEFKESASITFDDNFTIEQSPQDHPDLITRILKEKLDDLINDIDKG